MNPTHIPSPRIDPATLPPLISTGDPGSFARYTLAVRDPRILEELEAAAWFSPGIKRGLRQLREEILQGAIRPLHEDAPDVDFWHKVSQPFLGGSWLNVPWYWAETYLYRRILEIVGYFQIGAWHERDPFAPIKDAELEPEAAPQRVRDLLEVLPADPAARFELLVYAALWGNRVDLSYNVEKQFGRAARLEDERANLLVDDTPRVWAHLAGHSLRHLVYIADNAGTELAFDLALIDHLLESGLAGRVTLHLKPQPFYVSDAMPPDVERTLVAFDRANETTRALARRLRAQRAAGRLGLRVHWFYPTPLHYFEAPDDLWQLLQQADWVILKGDVNYRRLVGDAHWTPTTPFEHAARYFAAPALSLRTLKSELVIGLAPGQAEQLTKLDPDWRVNGKRGVAQARLVVTNSFVPRTAS